MLIQASLHYHTDVKCVVYLLHSPNSHNTEMPLKETMQYDRLSGSSDIEIGFYVKINILVVSLCQELCTYIMI